MVANPKLKDHLIFPLPPGASKFHERRHVSIRNSATKMEGFRLGGFQRWCACILFCQLFEDYSESTFAHTANSSPKLMRILIAPDKFKESLTAQQVAAAIRDGFHSVFAEASFDIVPVADGGEGTAGIFLEALGGEWVEVASHDGLNRPVTAS
jgi:Glycerate kinase family